MSDKKAVCVVFGKLSKPLNHDHYATILLDENHQPMYETLRTHKDIGLACDDAGRRQLASIRKISGNKTEMISSVETFITVM